MLVVTLTDCDESFMGPSNSVITLRCDDIDSLLLVIWKCKKLCFLVIS